MTLTYAGKPAVHQICAILTQGANNSKPMEVVGLAVKKTPSFLRLLQGSLRKLGQVRVVSKNQQ
jgi:hypothetical protein